MIDKEKSIYRCMFKLKVQAIFMTDFYLKLCTVPSLHICSASVHTVPL